MFAPSYNSVQTRQLTRRSALIGAAASLIGMPAIVRAGSLMPARGNGLSLELFAEWECLLKKLSCLRLLWPKRQSHPSQAGGESRPIFRGGP